MAVKHKRNRRTSGQRDAGRIDASSFPLRDVPALAKVRQRGFQVAICQSVIDDIHAHGDSAPEMEICGILLGNVYRDAKGPWCYIESSVRGNFAAGKETQVTITSETWTHVNEVRDRLHPDMQFIGWYHTHPGFGIFLSGMDDFICANWFAEPWQIALVYDPQSREEGAFVWRDGKTINEPFIVVAADGQEAVQAGLGTQVEASQASLPSGTLGDLMGRLQSVEQRQRMILAAMGGVGLIALVWPLIVFMFLSGSGDRSRRPTGVGETHPAIPSTMPTSVRPPSTKNY